MLSDSAWIIVWPGRMPARQYLRACISLTIATSCAVSVYRVGTPVVPEVALMRTISSAGAQPIRAIGLPCSRSDSSCRWRCSSFVISGMRAKSAKLRMSFGCAPTSSNLRR